jgi:hypothetical protein
MAKKKKSAVRKKRHAECSGGLCFHGAFGTKAKAEAKARTRKGAFVVKKFARWGRGAMSTRYVVATADDSGVPF